MLFKLEKKHLEFDLALAKPLTLEQVKALTCGQIVYLEEVGVPDSKYNGWCQVIHWDDDPPNTLYLHTDKRMDKFTYDALDEVYGKYWLIYSC